MALTNSQYIELQTMYKNNSGNTNTVDLDALNQADPEMVQRSYNQYKGIQQNQQLQSNTHYQALKSMQSQTQKMNSNVMSSIGQATAGTSGLAGAIINNINTQGAQQLVSSGIQGAASVISNQLQLQNLTNQITLQSKSIT